MSEHTNEVAQNREPDPSDSKADTIAIFFLIVIAVITALFFVSQG